MLLKMNKSTENMYPQTLEYCSKIPKNNIDDKNLINQMSKINYVEENSESIPAPIKKKVRHCVTNKTLDKDDLDVFVDSDDNRYDRKEINNYLDEYINYSRFDKKIKPKTKDKDIADFRKSYIDFRNSTYTSSHGFDPVDEMNLVQLNNKSMENVNIADVYDMITAKNFDTSRINQMNTP